ncbi:hypothetical protein PM10SUCC1_00400 [Propionigenium maris DSM 9537]|uniref:Uncharacterized protein n=1 Tax=Propionigenium maris DSM 9537 TaxID=1123000 RepID=A0A9W6GID7_9FUSO|nr:hypothetical protein [Propionigenium maris]GLI54525.1 hypothetical protein PM10SUCC1_00400 [Propionigenium maris DSM 9537]
MKFNTLKSKASKYIVSSLNLTRLGRQKFISQWGVVKLSYKNNLMWVQLLDRKVSIILEDRNDLLSYVEETIIELIPYDIINEEVQYKIF